MLTELLNGIIELLEHEPEYEYDYDIYEKDDIIWLYGIHIIFLNIAKCIRKYVP